MTDDVIFIIFVEYIHQSVKLTKLAFPATISQLSLVKIYMCDLGNTNRQLTNVSDNQFRQLISNFVLGSLE